MTWILFHYQSGVRIGEYSSLAAARRAMRASNRNAGLQRVSRVRSGSAELESCQAIDRTDSSYQYGPYAVMHSDRYATEHNGSVQVRSLMSGLPVLIAQQDLDTALDPSQERYWSA